MSNGITILIVRSGSVYRFEYVLKMRNMLRRHMSLPYELVCFTDMPERCDGITFVGTDGSGLSGWWPKMLAFESTWRGQNTVIVLDLDTVIIGDVAPLAGVPGEFAICENFARLFVNKNYPCKYNSSAMVIGAGKAGFVWDRFRVDSEALMKKHEGHGDQACIEELYPDAPFLQDLLPTGFFFNYRHLTMRPPDGSSIINFGGKHKPANCDIPWVQEAWA